MRHNRKIECIIMDWAGTTVDYGCFAPVEAFIQAFRKIGLEVTEEEVRIPMGLAKVEHIRQLLGMARIQDLFVRVQHRNWTEEDVQIINKHFEQTLFTTLHDFTTPLPGAIETINKLKASGIKIGSTTGYTAAMMNIVRPGAAAHGYEVDCCVTPDALPAGRPAPFMIFSNMLQLDIRSIASVIKVGDTVEDMKEGYHAGVTTIGVIKGSSLLGLSLKEVEQMAEPNLTEKMEAVRQRFFEAGADLVIDSIAELPDLINLLNTKE